MDKVLECVLVVILPVVLCVFAFRKNLFTPGGAVTATALAVVIGLTSSFWWEVSFFVFPAMAFIATKWKFEQKAALGLKEGKKGERGTFNVLAVGLIPTVISILYMIDGTGSTCLTVAYLSALAVSTADTVASELGPLAKKTYMITTLKQIEPGPNGGISAFGLATSSVAALAFAFICWNLIFQTLDANTFRCLIVAIAGIAGNLMDSFLGATLENPGYINKYINNASTSLFGAIVGFLLCWLI